MKKKLFLSCLFSFICCLLLTSCLSITINDDGSKYTKEDNSEYTYEVSSDKLKIDVNCSDIIIRKSDSEEGLREINNGKFDADGNKIKVTVYKKFKGSSESKLQRALDNTKCEFNNNTIQIGKRLKDSFFTSQNVKTTIILPDSVKELEIENKVGNVDISGDYDSLRVDADVGNINIYGNVNEGILSSDVGNIELNLPCLDESDKYKLDSSVGNIEIKIPSNSKINLTNKDLKQIKIDNGIEFNSDGAIFDLDTDVGEVKIES